MRAIQTSKTSNKQPTTNSDNNNNNSSSSNSKHIPTSHNEPKNVVMVQLHTNLLTKSVHTAPFLQGLLAHSLMFVSHSVPAYTYTHTHTHTHTHMQACTRVDMHTHTRTHEHIHAYT